MLAASLAGCASQDAASPPLSDGLPFHAEIGTSGFATILSAPPASFDPVEPPVPAPRTAEQDAADADFMRVADYQNSVMDEVQALAERLRREERGNFQTLHYDNEGELGVVFEFLRDGPATLRKYSKNPTFRGETVRWSQEELRAAADFMWETFREDRVIQSTGVGTQVATVEISVSEEEFRALVKRKGVIIPEPVELVFRATPMVPLVNPPRPAAQDQAVPDEVAPYLRIFPQHDRPAGALHAINSRVTVVLKDGCFRAADRDDALVLFPFGAKLFVDSANYLAFGSGERPGYARVGEAVEFMGSVNEVTTPELVDPIHAACGPGKVIKVEGMESAAAGDAQRKVTDRANAIRSLGDRYGLDARQAGRALDWLDARGEANRQTSPEGIALPPITGTMMVEMPPRPVMDPSECPPGSSLNAGLCRTPEGHLRPLPDWLVEFLEQDR
ncbi:hypothetical protein GRI55_12075 [Erythrobacter citreus]|uniref:Uncharacterized protein n=1 Tax=Qipengyuania citrea TaxID=225971 RepID=A0A6I4UBD2_9SPHN|nr:hypothetical protein [Qipengyuania citrea]MDQ0567168.1 hypothetical protein [Qipengyuania citrea]MXP36501.1 hypothetical protein [Qipengyuania citrea]